MKYPIERQPFNEPESVHQEYVETKMEIVHEKSIVAFNQTNSISDEIRVK